jgi:hypothetical protein
MYGMGAFSRPQPYLGAPSLLLTDHLEAPFILRFLIDDPSAPEQLGKLLSNNGLAVTAETGDAAASDHHYFLTAPASLGVVERAIEATLKSFEGTRLPLDVLYLPMLEGAHWDERSEQGSHGLE